jgi:acetyl-CoA carboxylase biotin carboxyl carrier protein
MADEAVIRAQIPGIFYRRPDPDSDAFVEEGGTIEAGAVVGLIEVMKQFHEVVADTGGTVIGFEVENEGAISPGDVVARIDPAG